MLIIYIISVIVCLIACLFLIKDEQRIEISTVIILGALTFIPLVNAIFTFGIVFSTICEHIRYKTIKNPFYREPKE